MTDWTRGLETGEGRAVPVVVMMVSDGHAVRKREEWMSYLEDGQLDVGAEGKRKGKNELRKEQKMVPLNGTGEAGRSGYVDAICLFASDPLPTFPLLCFVSRG